MSGPEPTESLQLKLVHSFFEAFKNRDIDRIATFLHKDHRRIYYPRSLGLPELTREQWLKFAATFIREYWTDCEVSLALVLGS